MVPKRKYDYLQDVHVFVVPEQVRQLEVHCTQFPLTLIVFEKQELRH